MNLYTLCNLQRSFWPLSPRIQQMKHHYLCFHSLFFEALCTSFRTVLPLPLLDTTTLFQAKEAKEIQIYILPFSFFYRSLNVYVFKVPQDVHFLHHQHYM